MNKPVSLLIEETKKSLAATINTCGLHISVIEMIMKELYLEVSNLSSANAKQELELYLQNQEPTDKEQ